MRKEELIALVKELLNEEDLSKRTADLMYVKREWRRLANREDETFFEKTLTNEFNTLYEELGKKDASLLASPLEEKNKIIACAEALVNEPNAKKAMNDYERLFDAFKGAGRTSKEKDDELFQKMRDIKKQLDAKLSAHYAEVKANFEDKKAKKEAIIEEAKKAIEGKNIKEIAAKFDSLMEEWKAVGYAGKDVDDALWQDFSAVRKEFQAKRKEHFANMQKMFEERIQKKEAMIAEAKKIVADSDFSDDEVKRIKNMRREFIDIGFAGKDKDDELWTTFNEVMKKYFDDMKFYKF